MAKTTRPRCMLNANNMFSLLIFWSFKPYVFDICIKNTAYTVLESVIFYLSPIMSHVRLHTNELSVFQFCRVSPISKDK